MMLCLYLFSLIISTTAIPGDNDDTFSGSGSLAAVPESPPQNITATIINSASVMLSWLPPLIPNGIITSYNVSYMATNNIRFGINTQTHNMYSVVY